MVSFPFFVGVLVEFSWFPWRELSKKKSGTVYVEKTYVGKYQVCTGPPINEPSSYPLR